MGREVRHEGAQAGAAARVKPRGGLVQDEELGLHGKHSGDGRQALLAAGELEGGGVAAVRQAHEVQGVRHAPFHFRRGKSLVARAKGNVLGHGLGKELALGVLHDVAHGSPDLAPSALGCGIDAADGE